MFVFALYASLLFVVLIVFFGFPFSVLRLYMWGIHVLPQVSSTLKFASSIYSSPTHYSPLSSGYKSPTILPGVMRNAKGVMSDVALWLTPDSLAGLPP